MNSYNEFRPVKRFRRLTDITPEEIKSWGVDAVGLDFDHTVCYDCTMFYLPGAGKWLKKMKSLGVKIVFITNAIDLRVVPIALRIGAPFVYFACKPKPDGYLKAADKVGCDVKKMAFIGDRLLTDVLGANNVGAFSVYVEPPLPDFCFLLNIKRRKREKLMLESFDREGENIEE